MIESPSETLSLSVCALAGAAADFRAEPAVRPTFCGKRRGGLEGAVSKSPKASWEVCLKHRNSRREPAGWQLLPSLQEVRGRAPAGEFKTLFRSSVGQFLLPEENILFQRQS